MIHIKDINSVDNNFLVENITSTSFLSEKKLIIIDLNKEINTEKEDFLLKILDKIPENNILLINIVNPDKRTKLYKTITKLSEVKEFNIKDDSNIASVISNKY